MTGKASSSRNLTCWVSSETLSVLSAKSSVNAALLAVHQFEPVRSVRLARREGFEEPGCVRPVPDCPVHPYPEYSTPVQYGGVALPGCEGGERAGRNKT